MAEVTIKTNNAWRDLVYRHDVPEKVLTDQFDHLDAEDATDGFVCYRGYWYHVSDFMHTGEAFPAWDGYLSDSAFSGVLIKLSRDGDRVKLATFYS